MGCAGSSEAKAPKAPEADFDDEVSIADPEEVVIDGIDVKNLTSEQIANLTDEEIAAIENLGQTRFFQRLNAKDITRDYSIIIDKSASMVKPKSRWADAEKACEFLSVGNIHVLSNLLLIYICNFHVLSNLLLIYICKLHWNLNTMFVCQVNSF